MLRAKLAGLPLPAREPGQNNNNNADTRGRPFLRAAFRFTAVHERTAAALSFRTRVRARIRSRLGAESSSSVSAWRSPQTVSLSLSLSGVLSPSIAATDCIILAEFSIILNRHGMLDNHRAARCSLFIALVNRWGTLIRGDRTCGINASLPLHARGRTGWKNTQCKSTFYGYGYSAGKWSYARTLARINHIYRDIGISR